MTVQVFVWNVVAIVLAFLFVIWAVKYLPGMAGTSR